MENKQVEIRIPLLGVLVRNRGMVDGKAALHVKQGGTEDYIHAYDLLEAIYGVAVKRWNSIMIWKKILWEQNSG